MLKVALITSCQSQPLSLISCSFLRSVAYREFSRLVYGLLGKKRAPLPACAYTAIRKAFTVSEEDEFTGFVLDEENQLCHFTYSTMNMLHSYKLSYKHRQQDNKLTDLSILYYVEIIRISYQVYNALYSADDHSTTTIIYTILSLMSISFFVSQ